MKEGGEDEEARSCSSLQAPNTATVKVFIAQSLLWTTVSTEKHMTMGKWEKEKGMGKDLIK